jgi:hypothetical protein
MANDTKGYAKTNTAAHYLDVSVSFLKKNMNTRFREGVHFFKLDDCRLVLWKLAALDLWVEGSVTALSPENNYILSQLLA